MVGGQPTGVLVPRVSSPGNRDGNSLRGTGDWAVPTTSRHFLGKGGWGLSFSRRVSFVGLSRNAGDLEPHLKNGGSRTGLKN